MSTLTILQSGPCVTVQDLGRRGFLALGVPESGAMDEAALRLANALVENDQSEACLEFAFTGGRFRCDEGARIAVTGGDFAISVDGRKLSAWRSLDLEPGSVVEIGGAPDAVYGYLAVAGGFDLPPLMGSRSTHVRYGIGPIPAPLGANTALPLRESGLPQRPNLALPEAARRRDEGPIRVILGPQDDYFTAASLQAFLGESFTVSGKSDRMGSRLDGPVMEHKGGFDIVSDGIAIGSIQVPGNGQPIALLADRQTTGGYPKIATVIGADLGRLAQLQPGTSFRFAAVTIPKAHRALREYRASLEQAIAAIAPVGDSRDSSFLLSVNLISGAVSTLDETWEPSVV
ncbi:biotin-dependent carboxyltransferase family protein [Telmatospirillum sp. J64-1]|uniref:5-oxoprolinase subunit C family protein n=1 Tax=Telmatospirillum sp. J64-1 TaxID=2502183 RepID=UPI00115F09D4|nr:biotin-dependent carboxyltransferase family protein [Telmatospirillum sp. J64-1]